MLTPLSICLLVYKQDYTKATKANTKLAGGMLYGFASHFGADPD